MAMFPPLEVTILPEFIVSSYVSVRATGGRVTLPADASAKGVAKGETGSGLGEW